MQITALVRHADHVCCRYRIAAYRPFLEAARHRLRITRWPRLRWTSLPFRLAVGRADAVVLQRRMPRPQQLSVIRRLTRCVIFDYDDAIFCHSGTSPDQAERRRRYEKFRRTIVSVDRVVAGNSYLAERATEWIDVDRVHVIPTCVEVSRYPTSPQADDQPVRLVWIGSRSTLPYLAPLHESLDQLGRSHPKLVLRLICDAFFELPNLSVEHCAWSRASEVEQLAESHIGIAWMPDDEWSRGKCGLKVLQYMAAGLPVIANRVGVHPELIRHGETGFLVETESQLIEAIDLLARQPELRRSMGAAGRRRVAEHYDVRIGAAKWIELLNKVA